MSYSFPDMLLKAKNSSHSSSSFHLVDERLLTSRADLLERKFSDQCGIEDVGEKFFGKPSLKSRLRRLSQSKARIFSGLLKRFRNIWKQRSWS